MWTSGAKSYLIDSIVRDLPVPVIFVRERIELKSQQTVREVVDGQQRLRTIFSYIDLSSLPDVDSVRDPFTVKWDHNRELAGKVFSKLPADLQTKILGYEFSTHVFPSSTEDRDLLTIFARINSTGVTLNGQELRNAEYYGQFKQLMYTLALEQLDRWRSWRIFSEGQIARMAEVELVSDLTMTMLEGLTGKTQSRLDKLYKRYESGGFPEADALAGRFRKTMDVVDEVLGSEIAGTVFNSEVYFFSLFVFLYDELYGLGTKPTKGAKANRLNSAALGKSLISVSQRLRDEDVPAEVVDAIVRASADTGRRRTRHDFLQAECGIQI